MLLLRLDGDRWPVGEADTKPHHHFIDAPDLLDIERSVAQPLAIEEQELVEHPIDRSIGDLGEGFVRGFPGGGGPGERAITVAFQPGKPFGIEEIARPGGQLEVGVRRALMNDPEKGDQLWPGAATEIHRVGVFGGVGAEPLEEPVNAIELLVEARRRQEAAVFGVEREHQPHEDCQEALVDLIWPGGEDVAEEFAIGLLIGGLEATDELKGGVDHLLGQGGGDGRLEIAALGQEGRQTGRGGGGEEPLAPQEQLEGGKNAAAWDFPHERHREGEDAGRLPTRGIDQPQRGAGREQPHGRARFTEEPLESARWGGSPAG